MRKKIFALLFLSPLFSNVQAADGCLLPNNIVYTGGTLINVLGFETFRRGGARVNLSPNYCSWIPITGGTCYVCSTIIGLACTDTATLGIRSSNFQMVECPLDDYTFPLTATAGLFGIFFIRKRKLF